MTHALRQILWIVQKDLLIEWRARARLFSLICFALTAVLLFTFAVGPKPNVLRSFSGAFVWLALLFSSTALLSKSIRVEEESGAMDSLLLVPTRPAALFYGKAISNTLQLIVLGIITTPVMLILSDVPDQPMLREPVWMLMASMVLGSMGLAAPGTLYAALTARVPGQQLLLPLLLFPLIVPTLLAAVTSTSRVFTGNQMGDAQDWLQILLFIDAIYWSLCGVLFERVIEQ
ncbi:MAG: heme exporter protein CcmB [Myxococcota bacterium]